MCSKYLIVFLYIWIITGVWLQSHTCSGGSRIAVKGAVEQLEVVRNWGKSWVVNISEEKLSSVHTSNDIQKGNIGGELQLTMTL